MGAAALDATGESAFEQSREPGQDPGSVELGYCSFPGCYRFDDGRVEQVDERIALEVPVAISFGGVFFNVFSCTPRDFEDLAYGIAFSHGFISSADEVASLTVTPHDHSFEIDVRLVPDKQIDCTSFLLSSISGKPIDLAKANLSAYYPAHMVHIGPMDPVPPSAIIAASRGMLERQNMHLNTGATHAASFVDRDGTFRYMSEDIGRHNAVEKLVGQLVRNKVDPASGFAFLSSRCALELVNKLARYGIGVVATVSAPTSAVIDFALEANVTLCAFARRKRFTVYTHPEHILFEDGSGSDA